MFVGKLATCLLLSAALAAVASAGQLPREGNRIPMAVSVIGEDALVTQTNDLRTILEAMPGLLEATPGPKVNLRGAVDPDNLAVLGGQAVGSLRGYAGFAVDVFDPATGAASFYLNRWTPQSGLGEPVVFEDENVDMFLPRLTADRNNGLLGTFYRHPEEASPDLYSFTIDENGGVSLPLPVFEDAPVGRTNLASTETEAVITVEAFAAVSQAVSLEFGTGAASKVFRIDAESGRFTSTGEGDLVGTAPGQYVSLRPVFDAQRIERGLLVAGFDAMAGNVHLHTFLPDKESVQDVAAVRLPGFGLMAGFAEPGAAAGTNQIVLQGFSWNARPLTTPTIVDFGTVGFPVMDASPDGKLALAYAKNEGDGDGEDVHFETLRVPFELGPNALAFELFTADVQDWSFASGNAGSVSLVPSGGLDLDGQLLLEVSDTGDSASATRLGDTFEMGIQKRDRYRVSVTGSYRVDQASAAFGSLKLRFGDTDAGEENWAAMELPLGGLQVGEDVEVEWAREMTFEELADALGSFTADEVEPRTYQLGIELRFTTSGDGSDGLAPPEGLVALSAPAGLDETATVEIDWFRIDVEPIPEPATALLILVPAGILLRRRRRRY